METVQGLRNNWPQFALLVLINAFVGGMVGIERSIFPQYALEQFGIKSASAMLSFIAAFGLSKAVANYLAGSFADDYGRRNLLIFGWILSLPIPFILITANQWIWVVLANILLGLGQGLTWSSTVVMKIDLVGEKKRGFAMGLNEFSGYLSVGLIAWLSAWISHEYGITPYPFYLGIAFSVAGLMLSFFFVKDTRHFVVQEIQGNLPKEDISTWNKKQRFWQTTWLDKSLGTVTQAGLVNNVNDGMIWGLLPAMLLTYHFNNTEIGWIAAAYPVVWGLGQLFTGGLADKISKKSLLFWGMLLQGIALLVFPATDKFNVLLLLSAIIGIGTALVYPTFLTTIAANSSPKYRAENIGIFRLWRDLGYVIGAILSGVTADILGLPAAFFLVALITLLSALIIQWRMPNKM